jgi:hypothetical protein
VCRRHILILGAGQADIVARGNCRVVLDDHLLLIALLILFLHLMHLHAGVERGDLVEYCVGLGTVA